MSRLILLKAPLLRHPLCRSSVLGSRQAFNTFRLSPNVHFTRGNQQRIPVAWQLRTQGWRIPFTSFSTSKVRFISEEPPNIPQSSKPLPKAPILQQTASLVKTHLTSTLSHENIYTVPNILTFSRLIAAPIVGYLVLHDMHAWAAGLFFYAGITDLIDGWIARKWKLQTVVGSVIDPLADKMLMTILTVCLAVNGGLPVWLATLILGRDISLAIAAIYYRYASLPRPVSFTRYWNFSLPSAEVHPTTISKANTFLQLMLIGITTILPVVGPNVDVFLHDFVGSGALGLDELMIGAQVLVAATTVWSGASYLWTKDAVRILGEKTEAEKKEILRKGKGVLGVSFLMCGVIALALEQWKAGKLERERMEGMREAKE